MRRLYSLVYLCSSSSLFSTHAPNHQSQSHRNEISNSKHIEMKCFLIQFSVINKMWTMRQETCEWKQLDLSTQLSQIQHGKTLIFRFCLITNCGLFVLWHKNCSHLSSVYALWHENIKLTLLIRIAAFYRETSLFRRHFSTKINFTLLFFRRQQRPNTGEQLDCFCSAISQFSFFTLVISMCWSSICLKCTWCSSDCLTRVQKLPNQKLP